MNIVDALDFAYSYPEPLSYVLLNVCFNLMDLIYIQHNLGFLNGQLCSLKPHETHGVGFVTPKDKFLNSYTPDLNKQDTLPDISSHPDK